MAAELFPVTAESDARIAEGHRRGPAPAILSRPARDSVAILVVCVEIGTERGARDGELRIGDADPPVLVKKVVRRLNPDPAPEHRRAVTTRQNPSRIPRGTVDWCPTARAAPTICPETPAIEHIEIHMFISVCHPAADAVARAA